MRNVTVVRGGKGYGFAMRGVRGQSALLYACFSFSSAN